MPSFEWNKIIASVLTALIVAMVAGILANELVHPEKLKKPVYMVAGAETPSGAEQKKAAAPAGPAPIAPLLAKADPKKGEQTAQVCMACHTFKKGEGTKVGPNLWNIAGGKIAEDRGGFAFSAALSKHKGQTWTPERLNHWLYNPQDFAKGTKMSFAGIENGQHRADVIAFLETNTPGGEAAWEKVKSEMGEQAKKQAAAAPAKQTPEAKPAKAAAAPAGLPPIGPLLAKADAKKGEQYAMVCTACHSFKKGGPIKVGPDLWGIFGAKIAEDRGGFDFSPALSKHKGQEWTAERLNEWLHDPQDFAKGTKMSFAGIKNPQHRADVIAYLKTLK